MLRTSMDQELYRLTALLILFFFFVVGVSAIGGVNGDVGPAYHPVPSDHDGSAPGTPSEASRRGDSASNAG